MVEFIRPVAGVDYPSRLAQLRAWFPTDADCLDYVEWLRWPDGFVCPHCGGMGQRGTDGLWRCSGCRRRVSVTSGTVFDKTRTPLTVWFEAAWLMTVPKNGVSALTLSRVLPVGSYQTAWAMLARLRTAMSSMDKARLSGTVEVDEWYHGGVATGGHALTGKDLVAAAVERNPSGHGYGRVRLGIVKSRSAWDLRKFVRSTVEPGSLVITDGLAAYRSALAGYRHQAHNECAGFRPSPRVTTRCPPSVLPHTAVAAGHPPRRGPTRTPSRVPRRVRLPVEPSPFPEPGHGVLPPTPTRRQHDPSHLPRPRTSRSGQPPKTTTTRKPQHTRHTRNNTQPQTIE